MSGPTIISIASILATILMALLGFLVRRALHLQDQAQAKRDEVERQRHESLQRALADQRASLETEIRSTRSDVRLVVGTVGEHGERISGAAALIEAVTGRVKDVESDVKKLVREGCAHRQSCRSGGEG
jgi:hypothetical protein